ncbi:cobalt-zinc-cadmium efflux system protein [Rhodoblastus acidophilus]|uniref:cation diffusion facilitator family transporter n=1 Tax=Rhodoblastus acidophilus TaxID=1074 RepID=UPI00222460C7|nr:cation diffusion facilitator family transporter [Rhodoblastus acidophilus]MCW2285775.1 cobalt-zinc-cadmium efflux system protein [Rhodoblastus acidophilus]MCW2333402.1 cobalt-zinc-cadmium efflux system protein [Rhodoblastus acidophilus]
MHDHAHDHHDHHDGHDHDHHDHDHHHGHGHAHVHAPKNFGRAFAIGIGLNSAFVLIEAAFGFFANSMSLLADAGHNLGDVLGLAVAWVASELVKRAPSARFTYGFRGSSILAALFNAVFLLVAVGAIAWEAIWRLGEPQPVAGAVVMWVAAAGIVVNGFTAWLFASGGKDDINLRGAFLHMASDALVSAGVVAVGAAIALTGALWLDPVVSLIISGLIIWGTWRLLVESLSMSLAAVPPRIDPAKVREFLCAKPGVAALHDLHIWPMSTTHVALTCHLVMPTGHPGDAFLHELAQELAEKFGIDHPTVQIEIDPSPACALAPDEVV